MIIQSVLVHIIIVGLSWFLLYAMPGYPVGNHTHILVHGLYMHARAYIPTNAKNNLRFQSYLKLLLVSLLLENMSTVAASREKTFKTFF